MQPHIGKRFHPGPILPAGLVVHHHGQKARIVCRAQGLKRILKHRRAGRGCPQLFGGRLIDGRALLAAVLIAGEHRAEFIPQAQPGHGGLHIPDAAGAGQGHGHTPGRKPLHKLLCAGLELQVLGVLAAGILRRLLRRAARHGKLLGIKDSFLSSLCETVIAENVSAYPELEKKRDFIKKVISIEEERFDQTIDSGLSILSQRISAVKSEGGSTLSGEDAFKLYDTFGFPLDITKDVAAEAGLGVDEDGFDSLMKSQKERARAARNGAGGWDNATGSVLSGMAKTSFVGYDSLTADT